MTTIAACIRNGVGAMVGDRRVTFGAETFEGGTPKVQRVAPWLVLGISGTSSVHGWADDLDPGDTPSDAEGAARRMRSVAEALRAWAKEREAGAAILALTPFGVWLLTQDGSANQVAGPIQATGSGASYAIGAMAQALATDPDGELTAETIAVAAVQIAHQWDAGTGEPVDTLAMEMEP